MASVVSWPLVLLLAAAAAAAAGDASAEGGVEAVRAVVRQRVRLWCPAAAAAAEATAAPRWFRDGAELREPQRRMRIHSRSLVLKFAKPTDSGSYACLQELPSGDIWRNYTLTVGAAEGSGGGGEGWLMPDLLTAPEIDDSAGLSATDITSLQVQDNNEADVAADGVPKKVVTRGHRAMLTCSSETDDNSTVYWVKVPSPSHLRENVKTLLEQYQLKTLVGPHGELIFEEVAVGDDGWYSCVVCTSDCQLDGFVHLQVTEVIWPPRSQVTTDSEDSHDSEADSDREGNFSLPAGVFNKSEVAHAPQFARKFNRLVAKPAGNMVRLKCPASGNPTPNITWLFNGEKGERRFGEFKYGQWSLLLEDLVTSDSGNYTCIVCNDLGCIDFTYKLQVVERVMHRPILTKPPKNVTAVVGDNVNLTCSVLSDLHPHLDWFRGKHMVPNQNYSVESGVDNSNPEILQLYNVTHDEEGWYTCIAANSLGTTFAMAYLRVVDDTESYPQLLWQGTSLPTPSTTTTTTSLADAAACSNFLTFLHVFSPLFLWFTEGLIFQ